jgi:dCTP deaminase
MSTLAKAEIQKALLRQNDPLVITPLLSLKEQLGDASVDVRLGTAFILLRKRTVDVLDVARGDSQRSMIEAYQERVRVDYREPFVLHPHQLVLGATLEYLKLPQDMGCHVLGRSSWGRLGLVIETASTVAPHFRGCITLELINFGEVPLVLYPGVRIAQLVFHEVTSPGEYSGKYYCAVGPQFSAIHADEDLEFWKPTSMRKSASRHNGRRGLE